MHIVDQAVQVIQKAKPGFVPKMAFVLGSGQSKLDELLEDKTELDYYDIPGFPHITVLGHHPTLVMGYVNGVPVAMLKGRCHPYEKLDYEPVKIYVRTVKKLGAELLFLTNASGSLRVDIEPGELMMITDHINMMPGNPLAGINEEEFGERFFSMEDAYDSKICKMLRECSHSSGVPLKEGVYISVLGPNFETAAEIKAFRMMGADAVGMSTVPEVLVARHCGLKVSAVATITNYGTGLGHSQHENEHEHEHVLAVADSSVERLKDLVTAFIGRYNNVN